MDVQIDLARFNMTQQQIRPWGVLDDRVLAVMAEIRREVFVPDAYLGLAYADLEIPLGDSQEMLAPKVVGRLLQALNLQPWERVLEVGTGSGYLSACLSRLGGRVTSLEIVPALADGARERLTRLGLDSIEVRAADALAGPTAGGPFDVIAVTGSVPRTACLRVLQEQLAAAGRMFCILGDPPIMEAYQMTRGADGGLRQEALFETCARRLANCPASPAFVF
ncbi:MAG TPA: protein-L-isoaspartate O-methyltransferase [Lamprocystis sp. (in: g-proteobacteria)]|nr:protein-L-isoaspartate O-methyltransferase [Lamprocystis sp. (in: g-proteobacteria)]